MTEGGGRVWEEKAHTYTNTHPMLTHTHTPCTQLEDNGQKV